MVLRGQAEKAAELGAEAKQAEGEGFHSEHEPCPGRVPEKWAGMRWLSRST